MGIGADVCVGLLYWFGFVWVVFCFLFVVGCGGVLGLIVIFADLVEALGVYLRLLFGFVVCVVGGWFNCFVICWFGFGLGVCGFVGLNCVSWYWYWPY